MIGEVYYIRMRINYSFGDQLYTSIVLSRLSLDLFLLVYSCSYTMGLLNS
jgi:hypothetical protein